ncbi:GntR family transcriptional regulator [Sinomonas albida]|uniref:GntR family transcriptional regulator n=1 Tax=Sinomonas albida TaxID=369942 RepID=UPI001F2D64D7|nr:GntR family transcriptional regulator [Sinomonas albida]
MSRTTRANGKAAPEIAYDWVKGFILALPREEEAFLNEASLAEQSGTSRTPVREALLRLEAEGFIRRIPHKGAYIPAVSDAEVDWVLQARAMAEKWAAARVVGDTATADQMEEILARQRLSREDAAAFIAIDTEFHTYMVNAAENPVIRDIYATLRNRQLRMGLKAVTGGDRVDSVLIEHQRIVDALRDGDLDALNAKIDAHLESTQQAITRRRSL